MAHPAADPAADGFAVVSAVRSTDAPAFAQTHFVADACAFTRSVDPPHPRAVSNSDACADGEAIDPSQPGTDAHALSDADPNTASVTAADHLASTH